MLWATVILIADSERQCLLGVSARRMRVPLRSNSRVLFLQRRLLRVMVHHCTCRPASCVSICFFAAGHGAPEGQLRLLRVMVAAGVSSTPIASRSCTHPSHSQTFLLLTSSSSLVTLFQTSEMEENNKIHNTHREGLSGRTSEKSRLLRLNVMSPLQSDWWKDTSLLF